MYLFKTENKKEFLGGIKINWLASQVGVSDSYLCQVLKGKRTCSLVLANLLMTKLKPSEEVEKYFVKKEK